MNYSDKQALVLGLGESGLAMAQWLAHCGARVCVADTRDAPERLVQLREAVPSADFIGGAFAPTLLEGMDFVAVSPGLMPKGELAAILPVAVEKKIPVWGEIELFAQALNALRESRGYAPKVIAITGTNGKTTVTSLTGLLCRRAGLSVQVAGNISPAALDVLRDVLAEDSLPQVWVLELSSFQLHSTYTLNADVATVLNVTQDHLDWHDTTEAYAADKARIFGKTTVRVLNRDDAMVMEMTHPKRTVVTFGLDMPTQLGCFGLHEERGMHWLTMASAEEAPRRLRRRSDSTDAPIHMMHLMPVEALKIRGRHNAANALAALALCRAIGLSMANLLHGLREYKGEPHRVELVNSVRGVEYFDDSKGTNVGATVAALQGLGAAKDGRKRIALIAGGDGKGQDFTPLIKPVADYVHSLALIGKDAETIRQTLQATGVEMMSCATLEEAVQRLAGTVQSGDIVLLSPACASMDMFRNYAHRAQVFIDSVKDIALANGEVPI
ncbi:MAG: UDP-N-acetylmuramoyl-L-alanine--D-glutamate ligase [Oxalobacter sp.]|nr:MAG: UDP-N-acetylmuramoyl-L-alanine--D-glutamate ligase [Oxalobacter sp.]